MAARSPPWSTPVCAPLTIFSSVRFIRYFFHITTTSLTAYSYTRFLSFFLTRQVNPSQSSQIFDRSLLSPIHNRAENRHSTIFQPLNHTKDSGLKIISSRIDPRVGIEASKMPPAPILRLQLRLSEIATATLIFASHMFYYSISIVVFISTISVSDTLSLPCLARPNRACPHLLPELTDARTTRGFSQRQKNLRGNPAGTPAGTLKANQMPLKAIFKRTFFYLIPRFVRKNASISSQGMKSPLPPS